jgi:hypothetical protein
MTHAAPASRPFLSSADVRLFTRAWIFGFLIVLLLIG